DSCQQDCGPGSPTSAGKSMVWSAPAQTDLERVFYMPPMTSETNEVVITDPPAAGREIDCSHVTPRGGQRVTTTGT
ncbi:hypothetical protein, partial [Paenarthrobacter aurescens]|uniref:hypothetical protein n=1 Tax=Paenarthrobacter aurescens TaxID=43663 RepID=UPI0021C1C6D3